ncbi:hypothetical protein MMPV_003409 [Pyropia vietnamensis]
MATAVAAVVLWYELPLEAAASGSPSPTAGGRASQSPPPRAGEYGRPMAAAARPRLRPGGVTKKATAATPRPEAGWREARRWLRPRTPHAVGSAAAAAAADAAAAAAAAAAQVAAAGV